MSKILDYAKEVLDLMVAQEDAEHIWTGKVTELVAQVCPVGYYSRIVSVLRSAGAIEQVTRGGGTAVSKWRVVNPDADLSLGDPKPSVMSKRRNLEDRVSTLERLVGGIDVSQALADVVKEVRGG